MKTNDERDVIRLLLEGKTIEEAVSTVFYPYISWWEANYDTPEAFTEAMQKKGALVIWSEGRPYVIQKKRTDKKFRWFTDDDI